MAQMSEPEAHMDDAETSKLVDSSPGVYYSGQKVIDCERSIRLGFIRKVYGILSIQLLATVLICASAMTMTSGQLVGKYAVLSLGSFIVSSTAFYWTIFILTFILLFVLMCVKNSYPTNYLVLSLWTIVLAFSVASACVIVECDPMVETSKGELLPLSLASGGAHSPYKGGLLCAVGTPQYARGSQAVLMALAITAAIFLGLTAFTFQSKWDFSFLGAGLSVALWGLILWGFAMAILGGGAHVQYLYSLAGVIIFSLYIVFDTWQVSCKYGPDEYILAAIDLYLDILNLFLMILQLLAERRD